MNRNLLFVSLFGLTELYQAVARQLIERGYNIYWITTNQYWTHLLTTDGFPGSSILELVYGRSDFLAPGEKQALLHEMLACEAVNDLTFNQCVLMDRFLMASGRTDINEYVYLYYRDLKRFLRDNDIGWVFAEPTNLNEMITAMVCRELGVRFLSPMDMRFPPRRMVFFEGYLQDRIAPRSRPGQSANGRDIIEAFAEKKTTPVYFERFKNEPVVQPGRIARAVGRRARMAPILRQPSLTHYDAWGRVKLVARRAVNSFYLRRLCRYDPLDEITGKVAYYGLHVQPENSVDVLGSYVSDQLKLLKDIRRGLPFDTTLVVKEHPTFLGQRGRRFFRALKKVPNVRLVDHRISSFDLYRRVDLVLTVSGTTAYEAGLLGLPAVTFSPMYFGRLSSVHYCSNVADLKPLAERLLGGFVRDFEADRAAVEELVNNSYDAWRGDPFFDRSVLASDNVNRVSGAFLELLGYDSGEPGRGSSLSG